MNTQIFTTDERYIKIMKALDNTDFSFDKFMPEHAEEVFEKFVYEYKSFDVDYRYGCSRFSLIFPKINVCVKIGFAGCLAPDEGLREEDSLYDFAQSQGTAEIFLPNILIGEICGVLVYAQEMADELYVNYSVLDDNADEIELMRDEIKQCDNMWASDYIKYSTDNEEFNLYVCLYYGIKKGLEILAFLFDNTNDLHENNIGFIDNRPVVFDYAGY